jgi:hypothetical protein
MCGRALEEDPVPVVEATGDKPAAVSNTPAAPRPPAPSTPTPAPAYTGGIFNLNAPAEPSSRNLDYLLEDDEPRSGKGLLFLGVVALALLLGFGYLRFRQTGIPGLRASTTPAPANPAPAATPS